jgi:hypothetical protein
MEHVRKSEKYSDKAYLVKCKRCKEYLGAWYFGWVVWHYVQAQPYAEQCKAEFSVNEIMFIGSRSMEEIYLKHLIGQKEQ